jgi:hypothetical protein
MPYTDFHEELIAGTTLPLRFTITTGGVAEDITAWTDLRFTGKTSLAHADNAALFQLTLGSGLTVINAAGGILDARIPPATTLAITKVTRVWCEFQSDEASDTWVPHTGFIIVYPSVTLTA